MVVASPFPPSFFKVTSFVFSSPLHKYSVRAKDHGWLNFPSLITLRNLFSLAQSTRSYCTTDLWKWNWYWGSAVQLCTYVNWKGISEQKDAMGREGSKLHRRLWNEMVLFASWHCSSFLLSVPSCGPKSPHKKMMKHLTLSHVIILPPFHRDLCL